MTHMHWKVFMLKGKGWYGHAEMIGLEQYLLPGYIKANSRLHSRTTAVVAEIMI